MLTWVSNNNATLVVQGIPAAFDYETLADNEGFRIKCPITYREFFQNKQPDEVYVFADIDVFLSVYGVAGYGHV